MNIYHLQCLTTEIVSAAIHCQIKHVASSMSKRSAILKRRRGVFFIYALLDPRDNKVRYIGSTKNPKYRYLRHFTRPINPLVDVWIRELKELNLKPLMVTLAEEPGGMIHAKSLEDQYIYDYELYQGGLLNIHNKIATMERNHVFNEVARWFREMTHRTKKETGYFYRKYHERRATLTR